MNNKKDNTTIFLATTFAIIGILFLVFILQLNNIFKLINKNNNTNNTETEQEDNVDNTSTINIDTYIVDTDELKIKIISAENTIIDNTEVLLLKTEVTSNLDRKAIISTSEAYNKNDRANIKYKLTINNEETLDKDMLIYEASTTDTVIKLKLRVNDAVTEEPMLISEYITIKMFEGQPTILKATSLEKIVIEESTESSPEESTEDIENSFNTLEEPEVDEPDEPEVDIESETEVDEPETEVDEPDKDNNTQADNTKEQLKVDENSIKIGYENYGYHYLPEDFTLTDQENNYYEYKSPDFITVTINYRENTNAKDFGVKIMDENFEVNPGATFKKVKHESYPVVLDTETLKIKDIYTEGREINADTEIVDFYVKTIYRYQVATTTGNYAMFIMNTPNSKDIITMDIHVPYELGTYFEEIADFILDSYEFSYIPEQ